MKTQKTPSLEIVSVNISKKKGTIKVPVPEIVLDANGVKEDAHAGNWGRQVSMLGVESFKKLEEESGREFAFGEFAENITTKGFEIFRVNPLDRFVCDDIILEVTQIGKKCHGDRCAIFQEVGNCVMPKEGIFCRVIKPGKLKAGDRLVYHPKSYFVLVITLSDRASKGIYEDKSGPAVALTVTNHFEAINWHYCVKSMIIPDNPYKLREILLKAREEQVDFIFTTGGTGIGPRDITPDIVKPLLDKEIPGIMEFARMKFGQEKPNALLSRSIAGVMGNSLVYTLPGSVKAVNEYLEVIMPTLKHTVYMLNGLDSH